jgi:hypothetical protein
MEELMLKELDFVEVLDAQPSGGYVGSGYEKIQIGWQGTVVDVMPNCITVEFVRAGGYTDALAMFSPSQLELVTPYIPQPIPEANQF